MKEVGKQLTEKQLQAVERVKNNPSIFKRYKPENQFQELVEMAIRGNGDMLEFVRSDLVTEELCLTAVTNIGTALEFVPAQFRTDEIIFQAVRSFAYAIRYVENPSEELCKMMVEQSGENLRFIKEEYQNEELCALAIEKNPSAISYTENQTEELCILAVKRNPALLLNVKKQTKKIVLTAIESANKTSDLNEYFYTHCIDDEFRTDEVKEKLIEKNGRLLYLLDNPTDEIILKALRQDGFAIEYLTKEEKTEERALIAAKTYPEAILHAPFATEEKLTEVVSENPHVFTLLSNRMPEKITSEMTRTALSKNPFVIKDIKNQTVEMCMIALEHDAGVEMYLKL